MVNKQTIFLTTIVSILFSLASCIDIDTEITFYDNASGFVVINYSVSKNMLNTGNLDSDSSFLPLPLEEQRYIELANNTEGLSLASFDKQEEGEEIFISARFDFTSIDALNAAISSSTQVTDKKINLEKRGGRWHYSQKMVDGNAEIDSESLMLATALFSDRYIKIKLNAPSPVTSINVGNTDKNSAEVFYTVPDLLASTEPITWEVVW